MIQTLTLGFETVFLFVFFSPGNGTAPNKYCISTKAIPVIQCDETCSGYTSAQVNESTVLESGGIQGHLSICPYVTFTILHTMDGGAHNCCTLGFSALLCSGIALVLNVQLFQSVHVTDMLVHYSVTNILK